MPDLSRNPVRGVPFITKTFSHACPTHAPGDQTRMHSVLGAFFQSPVSGEEKKRRILERVACNVHIYAHAMTYIANYTTLICSRTGAREDAGAVYAVHRADARERLPYTFVYGRRLREAAGLAGNSTAHRRHNFGKTTSGTSY